MAKPLAISEIMMSSETPSVLKNYISYVQTIKGKSQNTAREYFLDLRMFFRFVKRERNLSGDTEFDNISISDIDEAFIRSITLSDAYSFLLYTANQRIIHPNSKNSSVGLSAPSRARKTTSLRQFFKYAADKAHIIDNNPLQTLESPAVKRHLPKYLSVEQSVQLLDAVEGKYKERDYCILTLFLNCGLRVSELVGLDTTDIQGNKIRVLGKGNKERMLYLNEACMDAIHDYLPHRIIPKAGESPNALFVSRNRNRMRRRSVEDMVEKALARAGMDAAHLSVHKLRHTAATMMYQSGVDIRSVQSVLGHDNINTTMIYTHVVDSDIQDAIERNPLSGYTKKKTEHTE